MRGLARIVCRSAAVLLLGAGLMAGCSGLRPYPNTLAKNLHIRTETDSVSLFSKVRAEVDIFSVDADCKTGYLGTVDLDGPLTEVGIPADGTSYLAFVFLSSSFLGGSRSSISHETLLEARAGYGYEIRVSYRDDMYDVAIIETHPRRSRGREVEIRGLGACKPT